MGSSIPGFFTSGSDLQCRDCPFSCISTKNEGGHADEKVTKVLQGGEKRIRRYPADGPEKGSSKGLAWAEARGIFRHPPMGRSLPHDMVRTNTRCLSLHQHRRQSHPLQLRVNLPMCSFLLLCQTMYSELPELSSPTSLLQPATLDISLWNSRSRSVDRRDTCKLC
jgi:hypothetical protein